MAQQVEHVLGKDAGYLIIRLFYHIIYTLKYKENGQNRPFATMAQEVEHILGKDEVTSSNLVSSSTNRPIRAVFSYISGLKSPKIR